MHWNPLPADLQRSQPGFGTARMAFSISHEPISAVRIISIRAIPPETPRPQHALSGLCQRNLNPFSSLMYDCEDTLSTAIHPLQRKL